MTFPLRCDGVLCVDKPAGWSSARASRRVARLLDARVGHTGTLDPAATGLLVLAVGSATRLIPYLKGGRKVYLARLSLGAATDTMDATGKVVEEKPVPPLDKERVMAVLGRFVGEIEQLPPMYSALHHRGVRLYILARRGQQVPRTPRRVKIEKIELLSLQQRAIEMRVVCGPGTYVRALGEEIAKQLETVGHLESLRRQESDGFSLEQAVSLAETDRQELAEALLPLDRVLARFQRLELNRQDVLRLAEGKAVEMNAAPPAGESFSPTGLFWIASRQTHILAKIEIEAEKIFRLKPMRVIRLP